MRSVFFTCVAFVLATALNDVDAQDYSSYYRRLSRLRNPVLITSGGRIRRVYVPPPTVAEPIVSGNSSADKVKLDVYYETDCPDSIQFITSQLYPLYQEMEDVIDLNLVPYGKAYERYDEEKQEYSFICQHGEMECHGNRVQSCAISLYPDKRDHFGFINCMEQSKSRPSRNGNRCARFLSLDADKISKCANGPEGKRLLHEMAEQTNSLSPRLYFVPWIVVDKVFSNSNQKKALWNLRAVVCDTYKGQHKSCEN